MFWSVEDLRGYQLRATDDVLGSVHDVLFDDRDWQLRYVVADTGSWLSGRRVLISASALSAPDIDRRELPVALTREQVRNSPDVDTDLPVSRQQEDELHGYYGWAPYWTAGSATGTPVGALGLNPPALGDTITPLPSSTETGRGPDAGLDRAAEGDPHLRSFNEVSKYDIAATDGSIGTLQDMLIDQGWKVRYLVVDTGTWLPDKRVVLATGWVRGIDHSNRRIAVSHTREQVKSSPEYEPRRMVDRSYETRLYSHYGQEPYW